MIVRRARRKAGEAETRPEAAAPSVADRLAAQAAEAHRISEIEHQDLLKDPATNPATREKLEALRARQHDAEIGLQQAEIDAELEGRAAEVATKAKLHNQALAAQLEHTERAAARSRAEQEAADARADRQLRAADRAADNAERVSEARRGAAERALNEVLTVRAEGSPAHRVSALRRDRRTFLHSALAASALLAVGSGYGMGLVAEALGMARAAGWVTEVGMTGLSVAAITYRSRLTGAGGGVTGWRSKIMWCMFALPLVTSVAITGGAALIAESAPTGLVLSAVSALGSAAFGGLAHLISDISADAVQKADAQVDEADLDRLAEEAAGPAPQHYEYEVETPAAQAAELGSLPSVLRTPKASRTEPADTEQVQRLLAEMGPEEKHQALLDALAAQELAEHPVPDDLTGLVGGGRPEGNPEGGTMLLPRPDEGASNGSTGADQRERSEGANNGAERAVTDSTGADQEERTPEREEEPPRGDSRAKTGVDQGGRAPHHQARIEQGQRNRRKVAEVIQQNPGAGPRVIATATGLSYSAVRSHISALKKAGRI